MELKKYKLGELLDVTRGASLSGEYYSTSGEYVRLTCGNFDYQNNCFKENTSKDNLFYTGDFKSEFLMGKGDIIIPLTEQAVGLLGSTAIIPESGKYIQSQDVAKITCDESLLDKKFAYYLISSKLVKQQLSAGAQQTKIRHTSPDKIKECVVWIPTIEEQFKIGKLLSDIDKKIAFNREINRNLEAMARQLYDYWFVQFDFPDENGRPYKSSGGKMVWNERLKREIPEGWECKTIGEFAIVRRGSTITKAQTKQGDIKVVAAATNYSFLHNESNRSEFCITISSSGANAGFVNFWREPIYASDCSTVQGNSLVETLLCYYCLQHYQELLFNQQIGAAQPHVYPEHISKLYIVVPPIDVLRKIEILFIATNNKQGKVETEIESLTKQRDKLLPLLMNGQVNCDLSRD